MIHVTPAAHHHLIQLLSEHPEEHLVRIEMKDIDDHRIAFNIALESDEKPDDAVHVCDGLTIAVAASRKQAIWSGMRMIVLSRPGIAPEEADKFSSFGQSISLLAG